MSEHRSGYLRCSEWGKCAHCLMFYRGDHYCGAPWQSIPIELGFDHSDMPARVGKPIESLRENCSHGVALDARCPDCRREWDE